MVHHLMAGTSTATQRPRLAGAGNLRVEAPHYDSATDRLYINATQYLDSVPEAAYETKVGNYKPLDLWLRNREGRTLARGEIAELAGIVAHLRNASSVIHEINSIVEKVLESDTLLADA
jgi:hypothetical protein